MAGSEQVSAHSLPDNTPLLAAPQKLLEKGKVSVNTWTLSPQTSAELRINGEVSAEDLELLRDYVEITIKALNRKKKQESE